MLYLIGINKNTVPIKQIHFQNKKADQKEFSKELHRRVNQFFKEHQLSKKANRSMVIKTIFMLSLFILPFIILLSVSFENAIYVPILYLLAGLGMAGIGMGVMHDANHGSYSRNKRLNRLLELSLDMVGCSSRVWKLQHNVLHHTYTNVEGHDEDIAPPYVLRFSPHSPHHKMHRFQALYFWFFYSLSTVSWITSKDFIRYRKFKNKGLVRSQKEYRTGMFRIAMIKLTYFTYALILPILILPFSPWLIIGSFLLMHFVTGLLISMVFQIAHVIPETEFPLPQEDQSIQNSWYVHQMRTTANFSPNNPLLSWLIGGLNYQVEHHLFPNICHVHYHKISKIVKQTAEEYQIPYLVHRTFFSATKAHVKMLAQLGKEPNS